MRTRRPAVKRRPHRCVIQPEFGDWRVALEKPQEAEHLPARPLGVRHRLRSQIQCWQAAAPVYGSDAGYISEPIHGARKFIRRVLGVCVLLPLSVVMVYALLVQLYHAAPVVGSFDFLQSVPVWYSLLGMLVFFSIRYFRLADAVLMYAYVLGHELTHALAALMCFGKVQTVSVDLDGGYVDTDTDNVFISLSPYFVPLWMLLWMAVLFVADWVYPFESYLPWFYSGFGFWWSFHVYWTIWVIPREQPDLLENGVAFSFMLIVLTNIASLLLMLRCFGVITFSGYWEDFKFCAREIYVAYSELASYVIQLI